MLLMHDPSTAIIDPFRSARPRAELLIHDPRAGEPYGRDPRNIAKKAEAYLADSGVADAAYFGPEAEFYIFDSVRYATSANAYLHQLDSIEGAWNTGRDEEGGNLGYKTAYKGGYFPVSPTDHYADLRDAMTFRLLDAGLIVERGHREVGTGGQAEISTKYSTLLHAADNLMLFKYIVKRGLGARQDSHVHAKAAVRRERLGHAHAPEPVAPRPTSLL